MRPWLLVPVVALLVAPAAAQAQAQAPDDDATTVPPAATPTPTFETTSPAGAGGTEYGAAIKPAAPIRPLRVSAFSVTPGTITPGSALTVTLRVQGSAEKARMRVVLVPSGAKRPAATLQLGWRRVGRTITRRWTPPKKLAAGSYVARVHAVDGIGRTLKRTATASGKQPVTVKVAAPARPTPTPTPGPAPAATPVGSGVFPVRGTYSFGGAGARFGAQRNGHTHQGQDVIAAEGTPLVSPVAGTVYWRAVQASGAGHYLVIRGADGIDYVFMHLVAGSELVDKGDPVAAGQQIGQVGNTGDSEGPHLHFEIWPGGWYAKGSQPIDPLPTLQAWATGR